MKRNKNNAALFLLALYSIVLIHSFIVHDSDGELFEALFRPAHVHPAGNASQKNICESNTHPDVFSTDIFLDLKKYSLFPAAIIPGIFTFTPRVQEYRATFTPGYVQIRTAYYYSIFLLRSPPFA